MESQHRRYKSASASASAASIAAAASHHQHRSSSGHHQSSNPNRNTAALSNGFIASLSADRSFISPTTAAAHFRAATPSGRRRTLPELPMTPSLPSPSYSQRSAQSDPKSVWSKSPYNRHQQYNYGASSNQSLSALDGGGGVGLGGGRGAGGYASALAGSNMLHRYSSVPKLGSSKYRESAPMISRSFDNFSSPTPGISGAGISGGGSSIWPRPGSPFRNPSLYDRIRSRDHALAKMYRNYLSNNDLVQRYSQSQPGSPLRNRFEFGVGGGVRGGSGGGFRPDPFSSRSYRDLVESSKLRYDLTGSPASSSGYASWRGDLPVGGELSSSLHHNNPLLHQHRGRFGELSSVLAGSPTPMSPARNQRLREIMARSNANYYNMRESYNRLHQIGPSPPMSPLGNFLSSLP